MDKGSRLFDKCDRMLYNARLRYLDNDRDKYLWVLGVDVCELLMKANDMYFTNVDFKKDDRIKYFLGVEVQVDYINKDRISLYRKEAKLCPEKQEQIC